MENKHHIFIVEDDEPVNVMLCKFVKKQGFQKVRGFFSAEEMLNEIPQKETTPFHPRSPYAVSKL